VDKAEQIDLLPRIISLEARRRFWNEWQNDNAIGNHGAFKAVESVLS
jgi:hypothetical protein